jgi:filamentous hemagglutinin family protein
LTVIAASIQLIFADAPALANPTGPQVVSGAASIQRPDARSLSITNTPGTIINWQGFSIGAGELTRFIQQSPSSAVLNRVVGADISQIYGQLLSNGRVFLINPSGIVIGPGAVVDTAGFVASTLNMLDSDFLAGKLKFQGDASSGSIINQGWIRTGYGGQVILVAPQIENSGLIHTPGGEILLAAGKKLTVTSLDLEGVQFEVQAPTDSVLNIGKLLADGGAVGVFAGSLRHSGEIRANALVYDQAGRIVLKAQNDIQLTTGSITSADGRVGGDITVQSAGGLTRIAGTVSAQGSAGQGGDIKLLGDRVAVVENAVVDASGATGGGEILVGGAFQGSNSAIQNSNNTIVGTDAALRADATQSGDGGRIIVGSDDKTQF